MAGRPLRPATRRSLGEPLPHQLADRPRTNREVTGLAVPVFDLSITCGINPSFPGLSPSSGQIVHVLRTRPPLNSVLLPSPVRLACLIHAASVRSEPESNSPNRKLIPLSKRLAAPCGAAIVLQRKIDMNKAFQ